MTKAAYKDGKPTYDAIFHVGDISYATLKTGGTELSAVWDVWGRQVEEVGR